MEPSEGGPIRAYLVPSLLAGECFEVYREPSPQGHREVQRLSSGQEVTCHGFSDLTVSVDEALG